MIELINVLTNDAEHQRRQVTNEKKSSATMHPILTIYIKKPCYQWG